MLWPLQSQNFNITEHSWEILEQGSSLEQKHSPVIIKTASGNIVWKFFFTPCSFQQFLQYLTDT